MRALATFLMLVAYGVFVGPQIVKAYLKSPKASNCTTSIEQVFPATQLSQVRVSTIKRSQTCSIDVQTKWLGFLGSSPQRLQKELNVNTDSVRLEYEMPDLSAAIFSTGITSPNASTVSTACKQRDQYQEASTPGLPSIDLSKKETEGVLKLLSQQNAPESGAAETLLKINFDQGAVTAHLKRTSEFSRIDLNIRGQMAVINDCEIARFRDALQQAAGRLK